MNPDRFARLRELFAAASGLPEADRSAYLQRACRDDPDLRVEVEALLDRNDGTQEILKSDFDLAQAMARAQPTNPRAETEPVASAAADAAHISAGSQARFVPGTMLAGRYRVVAQIGRGGMGEVYRADDLRLGQTVALKFLPALRGKDPQHLAQLHREVKIARQISHPNVCRVFDINDAEGVPFLTMEFVDGEDLASLLKRIDRLQPDKATQLAHELCAGLAEAHAYGILHRDLKPANIMLDGRGHVRITDFGLAMMAGEARPEDARVGTPAYMAPEQFAGDAPTIQSDIYALGLVLYELFTGKEAFPGATAGEILEQRRKGPPARISGFVKGLDPAIERAILQCLERDPRNRPRTVLQIAAALPGGDPLSAALAAGETPSPEMVAAAADKPLLSVGRLWLLIAAVIAAIAVNGVLLKRATVLGLAPLERSPDEMAVVAEQLVARLGYTEPPADRAYWYEASNDYLTGRSRLGSTPEEARKLGTAPIGPWRFRYRQSPRALATYNPLAPLSSHDPPNDVEGMVYLVLNGGGKLLHFSAVPPRKDEVAPAVEPDWIPLLTQAGLDPKTLTAVTPDGVPPTAFDHRAAWDGTLDGEPIHIVVAANRGKPVYFHLVDRPQDAPPPATGNAVEAVRDVILWATLLGAGLLARINLRSGRGDRKNAASIAGVAFACLIIQWVFGSHHVADVQEFGKLLMGVAFSIFIALSVLVFYLAIEPYLRRRWPQILVSWNRALSGRLHDPRTGLDVLVGCAVGGAYANLVSLAVALSSWVDLPGWIPNEPDAASLRGIGALSVASGALSWSIFSILGVTVMFVVIRTLVRRQWLAIVLVIVLAAAFEIDSTSAWLLELPVTVSGVMLVTFFTFRRGILCAVIGLFTWLLIDRCILTLDFSRWYSQSSVIALVIIAALTIYGFRAALAGRPVFGRAVLEE